jgi:hypothetical protein
MKTRHRGAIQQRAIRELEMCALAVTSFAIGVAVASDRIRPALTGTGLAISLICVLSATFFAYIPSLMVVAFDWSAAPGLAAGVGTVVWVATCTLCVPTFLFAVGYECFVAHWLVVSTVRSWYGLPRFSKRNQQTWLLLARELLSMLLVVVLPFGAGRLLTLLSPAFPIIASVLVGAAAFVVDWACLNDRGELQAPPEGAAPRGADSPRGIDLGPPRSM